MTMPRVSSEADQATGGYRVVRPLTDPEYASLKESIRLDGGILVPVVLDEHGRIIDGHARRRAWEELRAEGVQLRDYPCTHRIGLTEPEKTALARSLNLARRQIHRGGRQMSRKECQQLIDDQLRDTPGYSNNQIAHLLGVSDKTVNSRRCELESTSEIPKFEKTVGADGKSRPARRTSIFAKDAREAERARKALEVLAVGDLPDRPVDVWQVERLAAHRRFEMNKAQVPDSSFSLEGIDLREGDCEKALADVPDHSVALILSDPPYDKESVFTARAYDKLGRLAARLLCDEGLLLAYVANIFLLDAGNDLRAHLSYLWPIALYYKGPHASVHGVQVNNTLKLILAFRRHGSSRGLGWMRDVIEKAEGPEKELHPWQQGVIESVHLIERLTKPGDLVVDPFFGSGTVAEACLKTRRRFIGSDIAPGCVAMAQQRLSQLSISEDAPND